MVIYADVLLAINFAVDYLIIKGACLFCGKRIKGFRIIISSAVGAMSSLIVFFNMPNGAAVFFSRAAAALAMAAAAICPCGIMTLLKFCFFILLQSFVISGVLMLWQTVSGYSGLMYCGGAVYFDIGIPALIICAVAGYAAASLLSGILARKFSCEQFCDVTVMNRGMSATVSALIDTGNSLVEPFSGAPVIVCELCRLGGTVSEEIISFDIEHSPSEGIRLIPYKTMDSSGLLPAFTPERIYVRNSENETFIAENCYIAVTTARLGGEYGAICNPKVIINNEKEGDAVHESKN